jgi:hypothetical protein
MGNDMPEQGTRKRAEEQAVENVRRITELLREERNNALAMAQIRREELVKANASLKEAADLLKSAAGSAPAETAGKIHAFLAKLG